jgi:hypothetical protein
MNKFDLFVENVLNITEGRKPKKYNKLLINFEKLENDIISMSDENPWKKLYQYALKNMKSIGDDDSFTNEELSNDPKTLPEWEEAFYNSFSGASLSKMEKKRFSERFFNFVKDPDREYFSEYVGEDSNKPIESMQQHIFDYINQSEDESATKEEIVSYIGRYGHEEEEISSTLSRMVEDKQLRHENGKFYPEKDPSLDSLEPNEDEIEDNNPDDLEAFRDDSIAYDDDDDDNEDDYRISNDAAKELGIDPNDPFGDKELDLDNLNYND